MLLMPLTRAAGRLALRRVRRALGADDAIAWASRLALVTLAVALALVARPHR